MLIDDFLEPKILIVSGKGGVGKTTISAALALVAARRGRKVCIAEVDGKASLNRTLGARDLAYEPSELLPGVWGMNISPDRALEEYLKVQYHMRRFSKLFTTTHFIDYITTAGPGLKDILVLGKIWYLEQGRTSGVHEAFDTIIVDAPAAGHMLTFLSAPMGLSDALRVGPVRRQSDWLIQMLRDPARTRVHLVTLAEEMPVSETVETSAALEEHVGVPMGPVFANAVYSELFNEQEKASFAEVLASENRQAELRTIAKDVGLHLDDEDLDCLLGYGRFLNARRGIQIKHLSSLRRAVKQPILELPFLFSAGLALPDVETLADVIEERVEKE